MNKISRIAIVTGTKNQLRNLSDKLKKENIKLTWLSNSIAPDIINVKQDKPKAKPKIKSVKLASKESLREKIKHAIVRATNYEGMSYSLKGCLNDAQGWIEHYTAQGCCIHPLLGQNYTAEAYKNLLLTLKEGCKEGDRIYDSNSSHGTHISSLDGKPDSGLNTDMEVQCPNDFDFNKPETWITDRWYMDTAFNDWNPDVTYMGFFDNCHAANTTKGFDNPYEMRARYLPCPEHMRKKIKPELIQYSAVSKAISENTSVIAFPGCQENQTSADAYIDGKNCGAFSYCALKTLKDKAAIEPVRFVAKVNLMLITKRFTQRTAYEGPKNAIHSLMF